MCLTISHTYIQSKKRKTTKGRANRLVGDEPKVSRHDENA